MIKKGAIRETKSLCPVCLKYTDAYVIEREGKVFLSKSCLEHGDFEIILSRTASYYKDLDAYYFTVMKGANGLREYELWPTMECNMSCSICCFGDAKSKIQTNSASCSEVENFIKKSKAPFFILSGGEPTCHSDLDKIIGILKKYKKTATINTNGLKLARMDYLKMLKKAGLDRVNLQFDGFDREAMIKLRGGDFLDTKLKAIENLKKMRFPTVFNATIAKNTNEKTVGGLIDYAAGNPFINAINFFTICSIGSARSWPLLDYIMPDEVIDEVESQTHGKISKKNVYLFNKLHFAVKSFFSQRYCFYNYIYLLVRSKDSYEPIDRFLNLVKIEGALDTYAALYKRNRFLAKAYLLFSLLWFLLKGCSIRILGEFIILIFSYFFKTSDYLMTSRFFYLSFSTGCDPYKVDYAIVPYCQNEIVGKRTGSVSLDHLGRDGLYCLAVERMSLAGIGT